LCSWTPRLLSVDILIELNQANNCQVNKWTSVLWSSTAWCCSSRQFTLVNGASPLFTNSRKKHFLWFFVTFMWVQNSRLLCSLLLKTSFEEEYTTGNDEKHSYIRIFFKSLPFQAVLNFNTKQCVLKSRYCHKVTFLR